MKIKDIIRESVDIGKGVPPEESKKFTTFLWIYHRDTGLVVRRGRYAMHSTIFYDMIRDWRMRFDDFDRGYIKLDPKTKTMYVMPTDPREYFVYDVKKVFEKEFPKWHIELFEKCKYAFNPGNRLRDSVKEAIKETIYLIQYKLRFYTPEDIPDIKIQVLNRFKETIERESYRKNMIVNTEIKDEIVYVKSSYEGYKIELPKVLSNKNTIKDFKVTSVANEK